MTTTPSYKSPNHSSFGTGRKHDRRLVYNSAGFLLILAIADGVLFGINSVADLFSRTIKDSKDMLKLDFYEWVLTKPIL